MAVNVFAKGVGALAGPNSIPRLPYLDAEGRVLFDGFSFRSTYAPSITQHNAAGLPKGDNEKDIFMAMYLTNLFQALFCQHAGAILPPPQAISGYVVFEFQTGTLA